MLRYIPFSQLPDFEAALAAAACRGTLCRRRDALGVALGLCGLRVSEVRGLRAGNLFAGGSRLFVPTLKGGRDRELSLDPTLTAALLEWRREAGCAGGPAARLLPSKTGGAVHRVRFQAAFNRLADAALGERYRFHALRHTFAMRCYAATKDLLLVQRLLGHRSYASTLVYADALGNIPESCRVRLAPPPVQPGQQLRLFEPDSADAEEQLVS